MKPKKLRNIKILILFILLGTILFSIIIINDKDKYSPRFSDMLPNLSEIFLLSFFIGGTMGFFLSILFINPKFYKPTKWKIILTIILTLIIIYYSLTKNSMCPLWMLQCPEGKQVYMPLLIPGVCSICMTQTEIILRFILPLLAYLIFSYAFISLIIFIYNKINKKIILIMSTIPKINWKEFFKPTLIKTLLTIIIFLISIPFIQSYAEMVVMCIIGPCLPQLVYRGSQSLLQFLLNYDKLLIYKISYINLITGLILSYIISCLIIFIYNKINKKKLFKLKQTKLIAFLVSLIVWIFLPIIPI